MKFNKNSLKALKSILGNDIEQTLAKSEIFKINTATVLSPDEMKIGLQIVPKTILNWLMLHLTNMKPKDNNNLDIPFAVGGRIEFVKHGPDNYSGEVYKDNVKICEFKHRSIPGIGLMILTSFELYSMKDLEQMKESAKTPDTDEFEQKREKLEEIIEHKLMMNRLVENVVNQKLSQRDAIERLIREKLDDHISFINQQQEEPKKGSPMSDKKSKLKEFLENREKKRQEEVELDKSEIKCSDCDSSLFKNEKKNEIKLCICYGDHMNKSIKFKKTSEGRVKFQFPKNFDIDNIEMLLEDIKENNE